MFKLFPTTYDGDQLRIEFSHEEELSAFEGVMQNLEARIGRNDPREAVIEDFKFRTTLESLVARDHVDDLRAVLGLKVLNIWTKDSSTIIPLPKRA